MNEPGPPSPAAPPPPHAPAAPVAPVAPAAPAVPEALAAHPAARAVPGWRTALRLLGLPVAMLVLVALLVAGAMAGGRWLVFTESGTRWLLGALPGVQADGLTGALGGETLRATRLRVAWDGGRAQAVIDDLELLGVAWRWQPEDGIWLALDVAQARARRVTLTTGPTSDTPLTAPTSLTLPLVRARVQQAALAELKIDALEPVVDIAVSELSLDGRPGGRHGVGRLAARGFGIVLDAEATIVNQAPLPVQARLTATPALHPGDAPPWAAVLHARGPLAALDVQAVLRGVGRPGTPAPAAEIEAQLRPFAAWPLERLLARTEALDLSALAAGAPQTRLAGRIEARTPSRDAPIAATGELVNLAPGRWNEGRLPFRKLDFEVSGTLARREHIELSRLDVQLADATAAAGRLRGHATWTGHRLAAELALEAVTPERLDGRAPAMTLSGPLAAEVQGLPSPDPQATGPLPPWSVRSQLELEGGFAGAPSKVQLTAEAAAADGRVEIKSLRARAGAALAELNALALRAPVRGRPDQWQLRTSGSLNDFDPVPWWPGEPGGPWRQGPHRLNAGWQLDMLLPGLPTGGAPLEWAQRIAGNGQMRLHESVLAGVPIGGELALGYTPAAAPTPGSLRLDLALGGNQLRIEGRGDPAGDGARDRWRAELTASTLATLAPLARLHPALAAWVPRDGSASATLAADGRWPALESEGQARVDKLQMGTLAVEQGTARWDVRLGPSADNAPLTMALSASGIKLAEQRADLLRADLRGTLAEHSIQMLALMPVVPPAFAEQALGLRVQRGTRVELRAQGQWDSDPAGGGRWRARVERAAAVPWDGQPVPADAPPIAAGPAWAEARELRAELGFDAQGALRTASADPGRVLLGNTIALRWDAVQVDLRGARAAFELRADVEAFALAPLLARVMPSFGWEGDLRLGARVALKAAERFEADMVFERRDGDLHLVTGEGVQLFGLTEFRIALAARDGQWELTPRFNGRTLGEIRGTLRARTTPERRWPDADAPVEGELQARVADLGIWSNWVPAGWRLAGELRTTATVGGRFGAPTYTGELSGNGLAVRNLLQGVNVREGQLRVTLAGETARVERFVARAGDGRVEISGGAQFGERPTARLVLEADKFRVLGRADRQLIMSGRAELALAADSGRLDGSFRVDEGLFDFGRADAPSLDDDVQMRGADDLPAEPEPAAGERQRRSFTVGIDLDLGDRLKLRGRGLDAGLSGKVRVTNPAGRLAVNGTVNAEHGTYAAYGQKLEIERGVVAFVGPLEDTRLDILAVRPNIDIKAGVLITGTVLLPRVRLYSDPELSDSDKLSWLLLGRAPEGLDKDDTAMIQRAAFAVMAGEGEAPTDALLRNLGIDELSVRQSDGSTKETVVALGKQLSRRWYVGYERGLNSTTGSWQLIYRVAQRLTIRAQSGEDNSLDVIWVWRFQEAPREGGARRLLPAKPP